MTQIEEDSTNSTSEYNSYGTVTESSPQTHPQNKILIIFSLLLMIAIGISAFLFIQNQSLKNQLSPSETCEYEGEIYEVGEGFTASDGCNSCSCTETGEVACTAMACEADVSPMLNESNNQSFTNTAYNYSFTYPSHWEINTGKTAGKVIASIEDISKETFVSLFIPEFSLQQPDRSPSTQRQASINIIANSDSPAAQIISSCEIITSENCIQRLIQLDSKNSEKPKILTIANNEAIQIIYSKAPILSVSTFILHNNNVLEINLLGANLDEGESVVADYDQILSTFEFTDQTDRENVIPSDWKSQTLQNTWLSPYFKKFTISYPPDWKVNKSEYPNAGFDLTLSKNDTEISISQGEFGWGTCSFPDKFIGGDGMISQMTQRHPDITLKSNVTWRIAKLSEDTSGDLLTVCELNPDSPDEYNDRFMGATQAGMIRIENTNDLMIEEIAQILSSIEIIE